MLSQKQASPVSFLQQRDKHGIWGKSHVRLLLAVLFPMEAAPAACGAFGMSQMRLAVEGLDPNAILSRSKRL
jgi:hypothetical protein